jgi:hypothetical protein
MLLGIILWIVLSALIGSWAKRLHRSGGGYFFGSLVLSPLIMAIVLACLGENKETTEKEETIEQKNQQKQNLSASWKEALEQNGYSQWLEVFAKNGIDSLDIVLALTDYDLEKIGMENIGERKKFMLFIKDYSSGNISIKDNSVYGYRIKLKDENDTLPLRAEPVVSPNIGYESVPNGTEVIKLEEMNKTKLFGGAVLWYKVKTKEGIIGWCPLSNLEKI